MSLHPLKAYYRNAARILKSARRYFLRKVSIIAKHFRVKKAVFTFDKEPWVLCRTACLGNDVRNLALPGLPFLNFQKGRVDRLENLFFGGGRERPVPLIARGFLLRKDVWDLLVELNQVLSSANSLPPCAILIDSYSDLTDQLFQTRWTNGWFFANYGDVKNRTPNLRRLGLLNLDHHHKSWRKIVTLLTQKWPGVPIFLLTYPTFFETRKKFLERAETISLSWEKIAGEFDNVYCVHLPPSTAVKNFEDDRSPGDNFPYHYGPKVVRRLARMVSQRLES